MKESVKIKKLIQIFLLGIVLLSSIGFFLFFCYMGGTFGYRDLNRTDYIESQAFANSLWSQIYSLSYDVEIINGFDIPSDALVLNDMEYDEDGYLRLARKRYVLYNDFLENEDYQYEYDDLGVIAAYLSEDIYNPEWYPISLSEDEILGNNQYVVVSKQDYIDLIMANAKPNAVYLADLTEDELITLMEDPDYDTSMLEEDLAKLSVSVETADGERVEQEYTESLADIVPDAYVYIDEAFDAGVYIGTINGETVIYSPDEDMFYSSLYGWYTVPEELYFLTDIDTSLVGMELALQPFTDKSNILEKNVGINYTEYARAKKDLSYQERNLIFYTCSDSVEYSNVNSINQVKACEQYLIIHRTDSGEFTVELHNFKNTYITDSYAARLMQNASSLQPDEDMYIGIYATYPYEDRFYHEYDLFERCYKYTVPSLIGGILMLGIAVLLFISLTKKAGRITREDTTVYLNFLDKWPVEIMFLTVGIGLGYIYCKTQNLYYMITFDDYWGAWTLLYGFFAMFLFYFFAMAAYLSLVRRGKAKQLWNRSLCRTIYQGVRKAVKYITGQKNLVAKTVELFAIYWFVIIVGVVLVLIGLDFDGVISVLGILLMLGANIIVLVSMIRQAKGEQLIREVTETLADGDFTVEMPKGKVLETERQILENIGHLSDGLQKAVEQSICDERMKAELITNVSHDIKTPLTSIINYVDLIKREELQNDKVVHYIEVLDQKSHRLKQLTEDLVEISKISSGNLELECMAIDFCELVRQSIGEFEDKFAEHELQIIDSISDERCMIYADGRRIFRVMDNLMQNIYKYAMPKTRVYIDLTKEQEKIILSMKNISQAKLNINVEELMERFVRGDQSRSTEGSGLGLSIAGDLIRLQNGTFDILLDGDLFKVIITFTEYHPVQENA